MKITKFIAIGAVSIISALSNAQANEVPITTAEINQVKMIYENAIQNFEESKNETLISPLFTVKPTIKTTLAFEETDLLGENKDKIIAFYKTNEGSQILTANGKTIAEGTESYIAFKQMFTNRIQQNIDADVAIRPAGGEHYRVNGDCQVNIYIERDGTAAKLTNTKDVIKMTSMQNEEQITMNQKLLLAHESGHCEFSTIQNPIIIPGKSANVNEELSYILRDQIHDNTMSNISYMSLLNENYADITAAYALIKEYGMENANLQYVLNSFLNQRQDNYFTMPLDTHFTHFSLHNALKAENIEKMLSIEDSNEMKKFILEIANKGVLQVAADNPRLEYEIFNKENFSYGIIQSMTTIIANDYAKEKEGKIITMWDDNIQRGLSYDIAKNILDAKKFDKSNIGEYFVNALEFAIDTNPSDFEVTRSDTRKINKAYETIEEMRSIVLEYRENIKSAANPAINVYRSHQSGINKDEIIKQMAILRSAVHIQERKQNKLDS